MAGQVGETGNRRGDSHPPCRAEARNLSAARVEIAVERYFLTVARHPMCSIHAVLRNGIPDALGEI